jgi:small subunit ribosomal protein S1
MYVESGIMEAEVTKTPNSIDEIERKDKFTGTVVKTMLGGVVVDFGMEVPGFVHISQLQSEKVNKVEDVVQEGQSVEVWVKRISPKKDRVELTMIEPLALEWREIKDGMVVKGTVSHLEKYGAFVEIGAERPGLVHISELAHGYIRTPGEAVSEGEEIEVKVLSVNRRKKQIKLSIKALMDEPEKVAKEAVKEAEADEKPVPTAMEIAIREAMERSKKENSSTAKSKKTSTNNELEDIYSRTLDKKVKTAAE